MFPSHPLMSAIQADRERQLERASRERRLLSGPWAETVDSPRITRPATVVGARPASRAERSGGPACEVA